MGLEFLGIPPSPFNCERLSRGTSQSAVAGDVTSEKRLQAEAQHQAGSGERL